MSHGRGREGNPGRPRTTFAAARRELGEEDDSAAVVFAPLVDYTPTALVIREKLDEEVWQRIYSGLEYLGAAYSWWVGDCIVYGEFHFPETYAQVFDADKGPSLYLTRGRAETFRWVARRIEPQRRRAELSFAHHEEVAGFESGIQDMFLLRAVQERMTRAELRNAIAEWQEMAAPEAVRTEELRRLRGRPRTALHVTAMSVTTTVPSTVSSDAPAAFVADASVRGTWRYRVATALIKLAEDLVDPTAVDRHDLEWLQRRLQGIIERERTREAMGNGDDPDMPEVRA